MPLREAKNAVRYASGVSGLAMFKLFLISYAVVGIAYVCLSSGAFDRTRENWWASLSGRKKTIFISGIAATLLQTFI